jgi:antitoxin SocA-like protein
MVNSGDKLQELILYIAQRSVHDDSFGKTKLYKTLFYADFAAFAEWGASITGERYAKFPHGPVPPRAKEVIAALIADGAARVETRLHGGKPQERVIAQRDPDLKLFGEEEIAIVDGTIDRFWGKRATDVSELSHEFIGWKAARLGQVIPYETALVYSRPRTPAEEEFARQIAATLQ